MGIIIDGKKVSNEIKDRVKEHVLSLKNEGKEITLAVILVGDDSASKVYVKNKRKGCEYTGINSVSYELPGDTSEDELLQIINKLNNDDKINGILLQLPLPKHIDEDKVLFSIDPKKDVDGFHPVNVGNLSIGRKGFVSCTPAGIIKLLKRYEIPIEGKHAVIIGRSNIVGKPVANLLLRENATVTICHSRTKDLKKITKEADIVIAAIGKPKFIDSSYIKEGAAVIDVGINRDENGKLCGDVDFESVKDVSGFITPVPGGVGPMTIAMLLYNTSGGDYDL